MKEITYSVVIPVYNSNRTLPELVQRINRVFEKEIKESYEIVFVDDFSPNPDTWKTLLDLSKADSNVHAFCLARNFGKPGALTCGLSQARGRWIITMDDDLQQQPEDIPKLTALRDHDVVIARFPYKNCSRFKKIASNIKSRFDVHLLGKPRNLETSPYKLIKRHVVQSMLNIKTPSPFIMALILNVTADLVNVDVSHMERKYGHSQYVLRKSLAQFSNMIFNNSSFMLRLMSLAGFGLAIFSFFLGAFFVFRKYWLDHVVAGWTALMVVLLGSTGMILFCLGILGEYVFRLISSSEKRPAFVIREKSDQHLD